MAKRPQALFMDEGDESRVRLAKGEWADRQTKTPIRMASPKSSSCGKANSMAEIRRYHIHV